MQLRESKYWRKVCEFTATGRLSIGFMPLRIILALARFMVMTVLAFGLVIWFAIIMVLATFLMCCYATAIAFVLTIRRNL